MDQINIIIGLAVLFLIGCGAIIALIKRVNELEGSLEQKTNSASFYSRESLNRFEEISQLRMKLVSLSQEKSKLQEEVAALKTGIKVINDRATALNVELGEMNEAAKVTSNLSKVTVIPTSGSLDISATTSTAFTQNPPRSVNKSKRKK